MTPQVQKAVEMLDSYVERYPSVESAIVSIMADLAHIAHHYRINLEALATVAEKIYIAEARKE